MFDLSGGSEQTGSSTPFPPHLCSLLSLTPPPQPSCTTLSFPPNSEANYSVVLRGKPMFSALANNCHIFNEKPLLFLFFIYLKNYFCYCSGFLCKFVLLLASSNIHFSNNPMFDIFQPLKHQIFFMIKLLLSLISNLCLDQVRNFSL